MTVTILSAFLSHKSEDKPLVEQVASQLGLRGVRSWLDVRELPAGSDLPERLRKAVHEQTVLVVFLSKVAIGSSWVRDELDTALELERNGREDSIIPVFLDGYDDLVRSHEPLRKRWMDPKQTRVTRLGIPAVGREPAEVAPEIADRIAQAIYDLADTRRCSEMAVVFDQRGSGEKRGEPTLPEPIATLDGPALLFRPDLAARSRTAVVEPDRWNDVVAALQRTTERALDVNPLHRQRIHWYGACQMALAALFGWMVERSSGKTLVLYDRHGTSVELDLRPFLEPLRGGTASPPDAEVRGKTAALLVARADHRGIPDARRDAHDRGLALAEVMSPDLISTGEEIIAVARDVTATAQALREHHGVTDLFLYHLSAAHLLAGVVALLTHVIDDLTVVEWRRDVEEYALYPMPARH